MKIMTFNTQHCLNYLEQRIDYPLMAKTIMDYGADIVGLNEMYGKGVLPGFDGQVAILSKYTGLPYHYFAEAIRIQDSNPYVNGLLSRYPIEEAQTILIPEPNSHGYDGYYEQRCLLKAKLKGGITVLVSHFGLNPDERESAVKTVLKHIANEKCILMGDFNTTPDDTVFAPIRERMKDTADLFTATRFSHPSDKPTQKIDYIFVSPDIEVIEADIPPIVASDHRPHTATIRL